MRELIGFACESETLVATLDAAEGATGLLIVSGGNEIRCGSHRGMAMLAARLAAVGVPVFRYDRRGIGDASGENGGFLSARPDLIAAVAAFRTAVPHLSRIVGFGNCDAASALALFGRDAGIDAVILANPWIVEDADDLPPAAAIRARYVAGLRDPATWRRLLRGGIDIGKFVRGLRKIAARPSQASEGLAKRVVRAIGGWRDDATILLADGDATAQAFAAAYRGGAVRIDTASHSFAGDDNAACLEREVLAAILRSPAKAGVQDNGARRL